MIRRYKYHSKGLLSDVVLEYTAGLLSKVEIEQITNPEVESKAHFITREAVFVKMCQDFKIPFTELERVITFDMFWEKYNHKRDKALAEAEWNKTKREEQLAAYDGITLYKQKLNGLAPKYPVRYLKHKAWL